MLNFDGLKLPFSISDLVSSGNGLLGLVGLFVLLGLAFVLVPELIALIKEAFYANKERKFFNSRGMPMSKRQAASNAWTMYRHNGGYYNYNKEKNQ